MDNLFLLDPLLLQIDNGSVNMNVIYRKCEGSEEEMYARWLAKIIYVKERIILEPSIMLNWSNAPRPRHEGDLKLMEKYSPYLDEIERYVTVINGRADADDVLNYAVNRAQQFGYYCEATDKDVFVNGKNIGELNETEQKDGYTVKYREGRLGRIYEGQKKFIKKKETSRKAPCL